MAKHFNVRVIDVHQLAAIVRNRIDNVLLLDSRSFMEYNASHVNNAVNVGCAKIMKRRLQQDRLSIQDFLSHNCHWEVDKSIDIVVYDQNTQDPDCLSPDSFMSVFLQKLLPVFNSVYILRGGFLEFQGSYPNLCEDEKTKFAPLTSLSQPCLPITNHGPTRILPFLYLGSQHDALNKEVLQNYSITYELNVSTNCPKPDFIQDAHFMRIPVIDNYSEKLLPHFPKAFQFLDKVRESGGCALVHCLAGISRSATIAIAYVMKHMKMSSDEAYRYVKSKRATISPNFNFLGQLLEYEKQLQRDKILDPKPETAGTPMVGVLSAAYSERHKTEMFLGEDMHRKRLIDSSRQCCSSDFASLEANISNWSAVNYAASRNESKSTKETYLPVKQSIHFSSIQNIEKSYKVEAPDWNIKCIPASSLKELNFTPCQTSTINISESTKSKDRYFSSESRTGSVGAISTSAMLINRESTEKNPARSRSQEGFNNKFDFAMFDNILSECKLETFKSLNTLSSDLWSAREVPVSSRPDLQSLEIDSKEYNRSDSTSTSGLGSEGSECMDSWNDYHSSCERETDILMDEDYGMVPTGDDEFQRRKMLGFVDSYEETSLYPKYDESNFRECMSKSSISPSEQHFSDDFTCSHRNTHGFHEAKDATLCSNSSSKCTKRTLDGRDLLVKHNYLSDKQSGKVDGLYRAQSCPGILSSESMSRASSLDHLLANGTTVMRKTRQTSAEKADKCRNRYSCSSLDYMDYTSHVGFIHESCPDGLCFDDQNSNPTSISTSHRTFRHSMIQVS